MNRIKEVLEEKGIKQVWLAERLGKSFNTVNGYVQNRKQPSIEILYEIADILNIEAKELIVKRPFIQPHFYSKKNRIYYRLGLFHYGY